MSPCTCVHNLSGTACNIRNREPKPVISVSTYQAANLQHCLLVGCSCNCPGRCADVGIASLGCVPTASRHLPAACHFDIGLCVLQQALNVTDRVYSVSADTVAPCGQLQVACTQIAPTAEMLNDTDYLDSDLLPYVDGIITSTANGSISPLFAFSASTDPGRLSMPFCVRFGRLSCMTFSCLSMSDRPQLRQTAQHDVAMRRCLCLRV